MMRFIVADDHSIVRMGLKLTLEGDYPDVIIDEAENGNDLVERIKLFHSVVKCFFTLYSYQSYQKQPTASDY